MGILEKANVSKERVTTGIALLAGVAAVGFIDSFLVTWAVLGITYLIAFYEANKLFKVENSTLYAYAALLWLGALIYPYPDDLVFIVGIVFASVVAFTQKVELREGLAFLYPTVGMLFILGLYQEYGMFSLLWLVAVVAMTDVGAFFTGKHLGKTKFCATSPNKTLEGVVGGIVFATMLGMFIGTDIVSFEKAALISFLVAMSSVFGDLFESYLKRRADVKDSGDILPGHGGVLDRVDGYLFGAVVMLVLLRGIV